MSARACRRAIFASISSGSAASGRASARAGERTAAISFFKSMGIASRGARHSRQARAHAFACELYSALCVAGARRAAAGEEAQYYSRWETKKMLINCAVYENGKKLADVDKNEIHLHLGKPNRFVWVALRDATPSEL